jgi:hypothetical protein
MDSTLKIYTGSDLMSVNLMTQIKNPIYGLTSIIGNLYPHLMATTILGLFNEKESEAYQKSLYLFS